MHETIYIQRKFKATIDDLNTVVTAEIHQLGNQSPYFSLTYEQKSLKYGYAGGAIFGANDILAHFPAHVAIANRWHLYSPQTCFMHYIANALYWHSGFMQFPRRANDPDHIQALHNTIGYGILQRDARYTPNTMNRGNLVSWLNARRGGLRAAFVRDIAILFDVPFGRDGLPVRYSIKER